MNAKSSLSLIALGLLATTALAADQPSEHWFPESPREEIRPISFRVNRDSTGAETGLVIVTGKSDAQHGWWERSYPIEGGRYYSFSVERQTHNVESPRRCAMVRIAWQDNFGKPVLADPPPGRENEAGSKPLAEPEHPLDGPTDAQRWRKVTGVFRAPSKATRAVVELHLQWSPISSVEWRAIEFKETSAPPPRKVRLAAVHYVPSGKSPKQNCEEYAPLIAKAAKEKTDLVVLGETIPYVRTKTKPHEVAEPVPGPITGYFGELAEKHKLHIVTCLYESEKDAVYNTAVLLGPDGKLIGKYRKVCLPHSEIEAGVTPGNEYPVFDTKLGKIGLMICYDGFFPEVARELTNSGAEIIAWPVWGCNPLLARARACENHVYVVSSTYTDAKNNWMLSAVFDHAGEILAAGKDFGDIAVAEVDLSQRHFWRNNLGDFHNMVQRHRPGK
jgi:predicted amidohydrolase